MAATDTIKIITPYTDIPYAELPVSEDANQDFTRVRSLQAGFGSKVFRLDKEGLWLGAETFATAPFSVDMLGNVTASSITLTGYVATGGAAADVNAGATTITGTQITTGSITASKMNVSSLSSISANIGTVTAGTISAVTISGSTITGTTLSTATSGQRVVLTSTLAQFYNSSGTEIVETYASGSSYLIKGMAASSNIYLDSGSSGTVAFLSNGTLKAIFDGGNNRFTSYTNGGVDLGVAGGNWKDVYHTGVHVNQGIDQPITFWGYVSGTTLSPSNDDGWSVSNPSTGKYTLTHNQANANYAVTVSALRGSGAGAYSAKVESVASNNFKVTIFDDAGAVQNSDFMFIACFSPT